MKVILLDEAKKWLEENCENLYTRMAVFGLMQSMPTVDYQEEPNEPLISGFDVIDTKTGEYPDLWEIALKEDWANGLMYCDMDGIAIREDGSLILLDECGNCVSCPPDRFEIRRRPPEGASEQHD